MSIRRKRTRIALSILALLSLVAQGCGTRLDRTEIARGLQGNLVDGSEAITQGGEGGIPGSPGTSGEAGDAGTRTRGGPGGTGDGGPQSNSGSPGSGGDTRSSTPNSGGPIVIGSVGTYSGAIGAAYMPGVRSLQAWASAINAKGGINGRKVEVLVYDDGGNGAKARSQVRELVEDRKAVAIVASFSLFTIAQWRSYVEEKKVPVVGGDCASSAWHESPVLFPQCASSETLNWAILALGAERGKSNKWGLLSCTETSECARAERRYFEGGLAKKAGLDPRYRTQISAAQADFTSECIQARNAGVGLLTVFSEPNAVARVAASCKRQNYNPQFLLFSSGVSESMPSQPGLGDVLTSMPTFPFAGLGTPAGQEFQQAWQRYAGGTKMNGSSSLGWSSAKIFEKAVRVAGRDVTRAGITKALHTISNDRFNGLTAPITYLAGKPAPDFKCWFVMSTKNGKWVAPQGDRLSCR